MSAKVFAKQRRVRNLHTIDRERRNCEDDSPGF